MRLCLTRIILADVLAETLLLHGLSTFPDLPVSSWCVEPCKYARDQVSFLRSCLWLLPLEVVPLIKHGLPEFVKSSAVFLALKEIIHMPLLEIEVSVFISELLQDLGSLIYQSCCLQSV